MCSLLHIDIEQVPVRAEKEEVPPVSKKSSQPPETNARLAWTPRQHAPTGAKTVAQEKESPADGNWETAGGDTQEMPNIIPSEFTHRTRTGSMTRAFRNVRLIRAGSKGKALILALAVLVVIGGTYAFKSVLFTSESDQQLRTSLGAASDRLNEVRSLLEQNDSAGARGLILGQLSDLGALAQESQSDEAQELYGAYMSTLNEIDRAEPASVNLVASIPSEEGVVRAATTASASGAIWVIADSPNEPGYVLLQVQEGVVAGSELLEFDADVLVPAPPSVLLVDASERTLFLHGAQAGPHILPTPDRILSVHWFIDYAYVLTSSGILKVEDLETVKPVTKQWLSDVSELQAGARLIAVDGDVWTLSADGILTRYFRGDQVGAATLPLTVTDAHRLLTSEEMPFLYIADTDLNRVHVVDKETMAIIHTVTFETEQQVSDVFLGPDFTLYILASDGKIWRVE
jgi:hypothetical protein